MLKKAISLVMVSLLLITQGGCDMANIKTLYGSDKLREAYPKVNENFNAVNGEINDLRGRVNNIITTPIDGQAAAQELVDARQSAVKEKTFETLDARIEEAEQDHKTHLAEDVHQKEVHGLKIEKGTWTPVLVGSTVAGTHTYSIQVGRYTKIDNLVYISMRLTITSIDSNASGNLNIAGLPFIAISEDTGLSISSLMKIHIGEQFKFVFARTVPNSSKIELVRVRADTALPSRVPISSAEANPSAEIRLSGVYETN